MRFFCLIFVVQVAIIAANKYSYKRHSEYASRIDPQKKFLPYSLFHNPNKLKELGDDKQLECQVAIIAANKYSYKRHSEYASRIDPQKKFLPYSLFHNPNKLKELGDDKQLECQVRQLALQYAKQIQPFRDQSAT
eukprot:62868_1